MALINGKLFFVDKLYLHERNKKIFPRKLSVMILECVTFRYSCNKFSKLHRIANILIFEIASYRGVTNCLTF